MEPLERFRILHDRVSGRIQNGERFLEEFGDHPKEGLEYVLGYFDTYANPANSHELNCANAIAYANEMTWGP